MNCPACQHVNRDGAKFCEECATPLKRVCGSCGEPLRPAAKFCDECGTPAAGRSTDKPGADPTPQPQSSEPTQATSDDSTRKVVTIIFADLAGSTALHERLDAESARLFMEGYYRAMRGAVHAHGGTVAKLLGDGVMAVFGLPIVAEDDAIRAVHAATDMQRVFRELAERYSTLVGKIGLRVAVNTGEVVAKDETELLGDPVNVAARLQDQAGDGDVVIGESTRRLVAELITLEPLGSLTLKGRAEAVNAYRVVSLEKPASATTAAFVGREDELARLVSVYDAATTTPAAGLAVLVGSPGLGKSRLIDEFVRRTGDKASVIAAHCDTAGGSSFAPITRALRRFLGLDDKATDDVVRAAVDEAVSGNDADRSRIVDGVAALLGGSPASPEETFFVVRRFLAALTTAKPVVLVIDDLHSAEPLLFDLVEHLVQWGSGVPLFVLVGARPELRDARSSLTNAGGVVADVVTLGGLDAGAAMRLAANMIGAADLPAAVAAKVLASSEGNPLFVGELVRMLVHEGALTREGDRWTVGVALAALEMPPTIHALLASRIERLRAEDRAVLERAAVVGRNFSRSALLALLPQGAADLDARLESLRRSELIESDSGWFLGEPVLRFHHVLIRDAAYRRLLKGTRAELHGRLAEWIETKAAGADEHDETIGGHLEQAYLHLRQLGPLDDSGRATGEKAAGHLAAAGRRSLARDDLSLATGLLGRALPCLDVADPSRAELAVDWCEAVLSAGDVATATAAIAELARFTEDSPRLRAWHTCFSGQLIALTEPQALLESVDAVAAAAAELTELGDDAGEAKAHSVHAQALARLGRVGDCETALDLALAAARRAGDRRRANAVLAGAPAAALWGPSPVTRASGRCLDVVRVLRITQGAPAVEAAALSCQGVLEALRGRTDAARRMISLSRDMVEELGISHRLHETDVFAGRIELLEGDAAAAESRLRGAYEGLRELGLGIDAARAAALLARALLTLDRAEEAEALSHESEALAGDDLQAAIAWRGVRAEALAKRGEHAAAVAFAEASVAIAAATDALLDHADARLALAAALRASGRTAEADAEEQRAIELWEAKGATLLAERARGGVAHQAIATAPVVPKTESGSPHTRRVHENLATRNFRNMAAAVMAGEREAALEMLAENLVARHHPTGATYGKAGIAQSIRDHSVVNSFLYECVPLAGLGENLCLGLQTVGGDGFEADDAISFGAFEHENYFVIDVDDDGRRLNVEVFAADHLQDAITRLYELRAAQLPAGPVRTRAEATARSIGASLIKGGVWENVEVLAPQMEAHDHRRSGYGKRLGPAAFLETITVMAELASDLVWRVDDIVFLGESVLALQGTNLGNDRLSGGAFERAVCLVWSFGEDGLLTHWELFEPEDTASALARLDELAPSEYTPQMPRESQALPNTAGSDTSRNSSASSSPSNEQHPTASRFENAASRCWRDLIKVYTAGDWSRWGEQVASDFHYSDRRPMALLELDREEFLDFQKQLGSMQTISLDAKLVATRGEQLCLFALRLEVSDETVGPSVIEHLNVVEIDEHGDAVALVRLPLDDIDAAIAELDARYRNGEGRKHEATEEWRDRFLQSWSSADWDATATLLAPDMVTCDHRLLGWGDLNGPDEWVKYQKTLRELAPDTAASWNHLRMSDRSFLTECVQTGSRDGGAYEMLYILIWEANEQGLCKRVDIYDVENADDALQRFRSIGGVATTGPLASVPETNLATDTWCRYLAAFELRDWKAVRAMVREDVVYEDRRGHVQISGGMELWLRDDEVTATEIENARQESHTLGVYGSRIAIERVLWSGGPADGRAESEYLNVIVVDEEGRFARDVVLGPDQIREAQREALARWIEIDPDAPIFAMELPDICEAFDRQDRDGLQRIFGENVIVEDHRLVGIGRIDNAEAYADSIAELWKLAPDTRLDGAWSALAYRRDGWVTRLLRYGTLPDGGAFESEYLCVFTNVDGRTTSDLYDVEAADVALARFEELKPVGQNIPPNRATLVGQSTVENFRTGDWDATRQLIDDNFHYEDRGRRALVTGDAETWIASMRFLAELPESRVRWEPVAVFGDLIALNRLWNWSGPEGGGESEIEHLHLIEIAGSGQIRSVALFDPEDRAEAFLEGLRRFFAGEAGGGMELAPFLAFTEAFARHDLDAARACLSSGFELCDHRPLSFGLIDGDQWIASIAVMGESAPDFSGDTVRVLAWNRHGLVVVQRLYGNLRDGGPFENVLAGVYMVSGGLVTRAEVFPGEDVDKAVARFWELSARGLPL